ncbi:MAG: tannase/feruloyl esterase family alpha/beta hydrolase [Betaproteobacteria bacterium]|nr:MAG: tannase/feruloyl esterase family alpha/beta hydrolase [Betaproteobacteria bacterium]
MNRRVRPMAAISLATTALSLFALSGPAVALPTCGQLATDPAFGLAGNTQISGLTAALQPASTTPPITPYCRVDFTFSGESGPAAGYLPGQSQQLKIRVGLPLSVADGGAGGAQGAWNGKNRDLGGGGYAGQVGGVTSSTNLGYVGTSTDTGHNSSVTPGGSFALNPDGTLNFGLIEDFASDGIHEQHVWGVKLAEVYYGTEPVRKYWMGCSTGGRQGHYQAQNFPQDFDGILAGANAFNWDRFITAELWPEVVMNQEVGAPIASAKLNAVSSAAIAACDAQDGIPDGIIQDPRACTYNATAFVCKANGGPSADPNCLTPAEASAVNKIWNGPTDANGNQVWYGLERGTILGGLAGTNPFSIATDHFKYWIHQNPGFDWHTVTEASFVNDMLTSIAKFNDVIGTDDDLKAFRNAGGKMITYHGLMDFLIFPRGTYHYYDSVLQGNYKETQKYYRYFPYPNNSHCGPYAATGPFAGPQGPAIVGEDLFAALVNWVEHGVAPDYVVAAQKDATGTAVVRTRKICMYPNALVYNGSGSTDDQASFHCETQNKDNLIDTLTIEKPYETSTKANTDPSPD